MNAFIRPSSCGATTLCITSFCVIIVVHTNTHDGAMCIFIPRISSTLCIKTIRRQTRRAARAATTHHTRTQTHTHTHSYMHIREHERPINHRGLHQTKPTNQQSAAHKSPGQPPAAAAAAFRALAAHARRTHAPRHAHEHSHVALASQPQRARQIGRVEYNTERAGWWCIVFWRRVGNMVCCLCASVCVCECE